MFPEYRALLATHRPVKRGDGYRRCAAWSEGFCVYLGGTKLRRSSGIHALSVNPRAFVLYLKPLAIADVAHDPTRLQ